jgi:hypothetical protein
MKKSSSLLLGMLALFSACKKDKEKVANAPLIGNWNFEFIAYKEWENGKLIKDDTAKFDAAHYSYYTFKENNQYTRKFGGTDPIDDTDRMFEQTGTYVLDGNRLICSYTFSGYGLSMPVKDTFALNTATNRIAQSSDYSYSVSGVTTRTQTFTQFRKTN